MRRYHYRGRRPSLERALREIQAFISPPCEPLTREQLWALLFEPDEEHYTPPPSITPHTPKATD
ncbi:MAG TPA: hypothetical protein VJU61_00180 [Polyangiaceae bacterium]|jgi:hypothetical protein|nr:hypothetical protein [Polyangiaceae bacterium]